MYRPIVFSFVFALAAATQSAFADTVVTFNATGNDVPNTISIHDGSVQMPVPQGNMRLVMDTKTSRMLMIDDGKKQYMEMDSETIKQTSDLMDMVRTQMMAQLENMPEGQRKMLEERMGINLKKPATPVITIKPTGKKKTVSKVKCEVHDVLSDGKKTMEACVATIKASGVAHKDYQTMKKMFVMSRNFAKQATKLGGPTATNTVANMPDLNGVPMEVKNLNDGNTITITSINSNAKLDGSKFKPGSNYKKINLLEQMQKMGEIPGLPN